MKENILKEAIIQIKASGNFKIKIQRKKSIVGVLLFLLIAIIPAKSSAQWSTLLTGLNGSVYSTVTDTADNLFVGGSFTNASGVSVSRIAKWDGTAWSDVGGGFDGDVNALYYTNGLLYAGGTFNTAGGNAASHIAVWNGLTWSALGAGCSGGDVLAITSDGLGNIFAAGTFATAGAVSAEKVAKWDGTSWSALGTGIGIAGDYIESLIIYNGSLFAGGHFAMAGPNTVNNITRWDGAQWVDLAGGVTGLTGRVSSLKVFNNELIAGGTYSNAGVISANSIAKWDGTAWATYGAGVTGGSSKIKAVEILYGKIFVGGNFQDAGGVPVLNIAGYDGTNWFALGAGANNQVNALHAIQKDLYVGGAFTIADTLTVNYIAKYATTCATAVSPVVTNTSCFGLCNGTASINASGNSPFSYQWSTVPSQTDSVATNLCAGIYSVTVTDVFGCSITQDSLTVTDPAALSLSFASLNPLCFQQCNGIAIAQLTNAQGAVSYTWNTIPPQTQDSATGLCAGTYTIQITDSAGCFITDSVSLSEPVANVVTLSSTDPVCPLQCNGFAIATSTGVAPFSYQWSTMPVQTTDTAIALCAGFYNVTITDSLGCTATNTIQLTDPLPQVVNFTTYPPTCFGSCNGSAEVNSSGPAPFIYLWNTVPPQSSQTAVNLCEGIYQVSVTDSLGCVVIDSISIVQPVPNTISFSTQDVSCAAACNGSATAFSTGFAPFTYSWSNGDTTSIASSLCVAIYSVTVTDSAGCVATDSVTVGIGQPDPIVFSVGFSACNGQCTGSVGASVAGFSNLTYSWSTGDSSSIVDSLCAGNYWVTIVDSLGCSRTDTVQLTNQPVLLNFSSVAPLCFGQCNGSVSINPVGTPPFNFVWSTGDTTSLQLTGLCSGVYSATISDSSGCTGTDSIILQDPSDIIYSATPTDALCAGTCTGHGDIVASGGTGNLTYLWNTIPTQNTPSVTNLCFGYTSYSITDTQGCSKLDSLLIFEPSPIFLNPTTLGISCHDVCDGFVSLNPFGGTPGYSYNWSNGFSGSFIGNVCSGTYTVTVSDVNLCSASGTFVLTNPDTIGVVFTVTNTSCLGCTDGSAVASVTGGTPPYDLLWPGLGIIDSVANNLSAGTYLFCVQDSNNCLRCDSVTISDPNTLLSVSEEQLQMLIYPNPFSKQAFIKISGGTERNFDISFYDISGRKVSVKVDKMRTSESEVIYRLYNSNLAPGMYYVRIFNDNKILGTGKFIIR